MCGDRGWGLRPKVRGYGEARAQLGLGLRLGLGLVVGAWGVERRLGWRLGGGWGGGWGLGRS